MEPGEARIRKRHWRRYATNRNTRSLVPTNMIPMVGSSQKSQNCVRTNDEGRATIYMSVIAHVYHRPKCMDDDIPAGDHDPTSTRSRRPRQETTPNGDGSTRSHPTNLHTSTPRMKSGKQMHGAFQTMSGIYGRALNATNPERLNGMEHCGRSNSGNASHTAWCTCDSRHSSTLCLGNF